MPPWRLDSDEQVIKTYVAGIVLGVAGIIAALHFVPVVDLSREVSIIAVAPNGGNSETFHVNIPGDRILVGAAGQEQAFPPGMAWPQSELLAGTRTELFKVRNSRDAVVGVGNRLAVRDPRHGDTVEWVLHFPARGTMYVKLDPGGAAESRHGDLRAGTREFANLAGSLSERWVAAGATTDDRHDGKVELVASYIANARPTDAESQE